MRGRKVHVPGIGIVDYKTARAIEVVRISDPFEGLWIEFTGFSIFFLLGAFSAICDYLGLTGF